MKKQYVSPTICVENAKLSAFCASGCPVTSEKWQEAYDFYMSFAIGGMTDGVCTRYCYHGSADMDGTEFVNMSIGVALNS